MIRHIRAETYMRAVATAGSPHFAKLFIMLRHRLLLALAAGLLAVLALPEPTQGDEVICYFSSWAHWRPEDGTFEVEDIDPFLCTRLIFSFAGLDNRTWTLEVLDPWLELCTGEDGGGLCAYDRFVALKEQNPDLITLLAVGGWREGSEDYSVMAADPDKRKTFIDSVIARLTTEGFDGLDMDWEYPGSRGGAPEDKANFVTLMQELREAFDQEEPPLQLSFAAAAGKDVIDEAYDVEQLVPFVDMWHIMAYDYHGTWENFTHHHSTLCGYYLDPPEFETFNVKFTAEYYISLGVPKDKMALGIATYGRCWVIDYLDENGIYAPASGPGAAGPYLQLPGTLGFNEICEKLLDAAEGDCTIVHNPDLMEPYFYCRSDNMWCGYDDGDSVYIKARYAKNLGLAGVLVWQIDTDDFQPFCYDEPFHLVHNMKRALELPAGDENEVVCPHASTGTSTERWSTTDQATETSELTFETSELTFETSELTFETSELTFETSELTFETSELTFETSELTFETTSETTAETTAELTFETTSETTAKTTAETTAETTSELTFETTSETTAETTTEAPTETTAETSSEPTTVPVSTTTRPPHVRPDCTGLPDGTTFPHSDCNKYWECISGVGILELCSPGTVWDDSIKVCNWEDDVDTSNCYTWVCSVDNTYYPHPDCDKYYWCYQGSPHEEQCPDGNYWSQELTQCVRPSDVDTSTCNVP